MSEAKVTPEVIEQMLDRVSKASERISKDIDKNLKELDRRITSFVDQGEKITERLVKAIDKELRSQIAALQHEIGQLARRVSELSSNATHRKDAVIESARKSVGAKAPAAKSVARKPAARRPAATKPAGMKPVAKTAPGGASRTRKVAA